MSIDASSHKCANGHVREEVVGMIVGLAHLCMQACYCPRLSLYIRSLIDTTTPAAAACTHLPELCKMP